MKSKKGVAIQTVIIISVIVITFFVLLGFLYPAKMAITDALLKQNCRNSIFAHRIGNIQGADFIKDINCPTEYETIDGTEAEIKEDLATEMWDCWDKFGRGEAELFQATTEKFCAVCTIVEFGPSARNRELEIDDFSTYIKEKKVFRQNSLIEKVGGFAHAEYMFNPEDLTEFENLKFTIDTKNDYAIMFTYAKESFWSRTKRAIVWGSVGAGVGAVAGAAIWIATDGIGAPIFVGLTILGGVAGSTIGAAVPTPEAEPGQEKGQSALWIPGIVLIQKEAIPELGCTYLPVEQKTD